MRRKYNFSIIKNLKVGQKLALMGVVFMIPFAVVTYKLVTSVDSLGVEFAGKESRGLEYCAPLMKLLQALQERRELDCLATADRPFTEQLAANAAELAVQVFHQPKVVWIIGYLLVLRCTSSENDLITL